MSVRIEMSSIPVEVRKKIAKDLMLKEYSWSKQGFTQATGKTLIGFKMSDDQKYVYLPYFYAHKLLGKSFPNSYRQEIYAKVKPFSMINRAKPEVPFKFFDYQLEAIGLANQDYQTTGTAFFNVYCAFGKTVTATGITSILASNLGLRTLITYPFDIVGKSWRGTLEALTDAVVYEVGSNKPFDPQTQVILCIDERLKDIPDVICDTIGSLIIDEAHLYCTQRNVENLLRIQPMYITALTATYERDDKFHIILDHMVSPTRIVSISKKPFYVLEYHTGVTPNEESIRTSSRGIQFESVNKALSMSQERNNLICSLVLLNSSEKILILTYHKEHAETLYGMLTFYLQNTGRTVSILYSTMKTYDDADILIATISKAGVGFDEKEACRSWNGKRLNMLILCASTKKIEQFAGRVFRSETPIIVDLVDEQKNIKEHYRLRKKWYQSRNGIVQPISGLFVWSQLSQKFLEKYNRAIQLGTVNPILRVTSDYTSSDPVESVGSKEEELQDILSMYTD